MEALDSRRDFAALSQSIYLNQAALGLIPVQSIEVMINHLTETAQHGNARLTDEDELRILDDLYIAGADLLGTEAQSVAVLGGASEGLASAAALMPAGEVVLVSSDFPQRHPSMARRIGERTIRRMGRGRSGCQLDRIADRRREAGRRRRMRQRSDVRNRDQS